MTPDLKEEMREFEIYLSHLKLTNKEDVLIFCEAYSDWRFKCPENKRLEAAAKYVAVMSKFGTQLLAHVAKEIHYGKEIKSLRSREDHASN